MKPVLGIRGILARIPIRIRTSDSWIRIQLPIRFVKDAKKLYFQYFSYNFPAGT